MSGFAAVSRDSPCEAFSQASISFALAAASSWTRQWDFEGYVSFLRARSTDCCRLSGRRLLMVEPRGWPFVMSTELWAFQWNPPEASKIYPMSHPQEQPYLKTEVQSSEIRERLVESAALR